jgi:hypothetical protein
LFKGGRWALLLLLLLMAGSSQQQTLQQLLVLLLLLLVRGRGGALSSEARYAEQMGEGRRRRLVEQAGEPELVVGVSSPSSSSRWAPQHQLSAGYHA